LELGLSLAVVAGAALIAWFDPLTLPSLGLGVGAALVATIFSYCNATLVRDHDSFTITFFEMLAACGLMALVSVLFLDPAAPKVPTSANDWILLLVLSQVCTVLAFSACVWLQKRLTVYSIGLASNLEPVYGIVLAAVVFREHKNLHFTFWIGSSIIIAAVLAYLPLQRRIEGWQQGRIS
jgi:drug/metabolite transporter (DMT)-like permease